MPGELSNDRATIREVYGLIDRLRVEFGDRLTAIEQKLDGTQLTMEQRVRSLETWRAWMTGVGAVVTLALTIAVTFSARLIG